MSRSLPRGACAAPLRTRLGLLTKCRRSRVEAVVAADEYIAVEVTW